MTTEQESIIPTNDNTILNSPSSNFDYLTSIVVDKMDMMIPQEFQLPFVIVVSFWRGSFFLVILFICCFLY
jgi:hypothetical protein